MRDKNEGPVIRVSKARKAPVKVLAEVRSALKRGAPVVALESTVITHGMPWPQNLDMAVRMEQTVQARGATPATIAMLEGRLRVGLEANELEGLAQVQGLRKLSLRDLGAGIAQGASGGTTVAATMFVAQKAGINVFATGGIGGVHRGNAMDVSADLQELGRSPVLVVCAGAKAILDLPGTLEYLETQGVPVIGYGTDHLPAFYAADSGLPLELRADTPEEVAEIAQAHWSLGLGSGILVVVPPPKEHAMPYAEVEKVVEKALKASVKDGIKGNKVTPYLLAKVAELSDGESLEANIALLLNNAGVAAQIAAAMAEPKALQLNY